MGREKSKKCSLYDDGFVTNETLSFDGETGVFVSKSGHVYKEVSQWEDSHGYRYVSIGAKNIPVHRFVALHFCPGRTQEKKVVMHKDDNPLNNHAENLEWGTSSKNNYDAYQHGLKKRRVMVRCMETGEVFATARDAARKMFGVPKRGDHIISIIRSERPKAYGYHWEEVVSR